MVLDLLFTHFSRLGVLPQMSFLGIRLFFSSPVVVKGELRVLTLNILGNLFCSIYNN